MLLSILVFPEPRLTSHLLTFAQLGYFRIVMGHNSLGIESSIAWATPKAFTVHNFPCNEDASNCQGDTKTGGVRTQYYEDPSKHGEALGSRMMQG